MKRIISKPTDAEKRAEEAALAVIENGLCRSWNKKNIVKPMMDELRSMLGEQVSVIP